MRGVDYLGATGDHVNPKASSNVLTILFLSDQARFCRLLTSLIGLKVLSEMSLDRDTYSSACEDIWDSAIEAVKIGQADGLTHLFRLHPAVLSPQDIVLAYLATVSLSTATLQVLLDYGWDINRPESQLEPRIHGICTIARRRLTEADREKEGWRKRGTDSLVS
jgi:hypothetical protein